MADDDDPRRRRGFRIAPGARDTGQSQWQPVAPVQFGSPLGMAGGILQSGAMEDLRNERRKAELAEVMAGKVPGAAPAPDVGFFGRLGRLFSGGSSNG